MLCWSDENGGHWSLGTAGTRPWNSGCRQLTLGTHLTVCVWSKRGNSRTHEVRCVRSRLIKQLIVLFGYCAEHTSATCNCVYLTAVIAVYCRHFRIRSLAIWSWTKLSFPQCCCLCHWRSEAISASRREMGQMFTPQSNLKLLLCDSNT